MFQKKPSASEVDGVQYRRAKTWQIICYACNAFVGMSVYSLIGMASYSASIGYGITTATVGIIWPAFWTASPTRCWRSSMTASTPVSASCAFC